MKTKKETKIKEVDESAKDGRDLLQIASKADLKLFLTGVRDKLLKEQSPAIFAMGAMKHVLTHDEIYELLDTQSKEILQEIWVKLAQSGFHLRKPPLLFTDVETAAAKA